MLFAATWMDLEGIMLSEIRQTKTNTVQDHLYVESQKYNKTVTVTKKEADSQLQGTNQWLPVEGQSNTEDFFKRGYYGIIRNYR